MKNKGDKILDFIFNKVIFQTFKLKKTNPYLCRPQEKQPVDFRFGGGRKVRTPKSSKADNIRRSRDQDKCNRKYVYSFIVKPGKLFAVQC